ncbi:MAG: hypothetical protein ACXVNM_13710 [Bacteroidia bacterium]
MKSSKPAIGIDIIAVITGTFYLLCYCILLQYETTKSIALIMLGIAPFMLVWMVYTVLKHGKYNGPELNGEEFGYQDKNKDELGTF